MRSGSDKFRRIPLAISGRIEYNQVRTDNVRTAEGVAYGRDGPSDTGLRKRKTPGGVSEAAQQHYRKNPPAQRNPGLRRERGQPGPNRWEAADMNKWNPFRDESLTARQTVLAVGLVFVIAGISGWVYEELFYRLNDGCFSWRGHGFGPWLPIYAFGTVILLFVTAPVKDSKGKTALLCALVSGSFEFLVGWAIYHLFDGLRLWDYNTERWNWGNIGGYVCFRSVLVFALAAPLLIYMLVPLIGKLARKLPGWAYTLITAIPFALFVLDILQGYVIKGL